MIQTIIENYSQSKYRVVNPSAKWQIYNTTSLFKAQESL